VSPRSSRLTFATFVAAGAIAGCSCERSGQPSAGASSAAPGQPSASGAPPVVNALPWSQESVQKVVNPNGEAPYAGPTGTVRGTVAVKGDPPPILGEVVEKIPDKCKDARLVHGRLFREGMMRSLADALVTVTDYKGFLPAKTGVVTVIGKECSWSTRTVALTFGQRLDVQSKDGESYVPKLIGGQMKADMVAVPGGSAVKLYPHVPGRYTLLDQMHLWMTADVFVLKYPTATVTGLDGKFEIKGVPVGEVTVSALMPSTMQVAQETKVRVEADKTVEVSLEIEFDEKKHAPQLQKPKAPKVEIH